jgi:hypothetical protein
MSKTANKPIKLILALTQDDQDGSMLALAEAMREKGFRQGFQVAFAEASTVDGLHLAHNKLIATSRKADISELMVVGHSEYFTNKTNFTEKLYDIIPIAARTLGGLPLESVSELILSLVNSKRIPCVTLLCCESATTISFYECSVAPSTWLVHEVFDDAMQSAIIDRAGDSDISSLQFICSTIYAHSFRCPRVTGLNGFGYIDPTDDGPTMTFPSDLYHAIPDFNTGRRAVFGNKAARHDRVSDMLMASCLAKTSPHMVSYTIERS